jgi:peptidylprolyl isomerase
MAEAKTGDKVNVHYTGKLDDGSVFDSSEGHDPLQFTIGEHEVIPGFENGVVGMNAGDSKTVRIEAGDAYGERTDDLVFQVSRDQFPDDSDVSVGDVVRVGFADGRTAPMQVAAVSDHSITLDANHPLAGKALTFDLKLVSIEKV